MAMPAVHGAGRRLVGHVARLQLPEPAAVVARLSARSCGPTGRATPDRSGACAEALRAPAGRVSPELEGRAGRPDIAYPGRSVAIFVHGCYWHHCPRCYPNLPKSNPEFWARKFELNRERDARSAGSRPRLAVVEAWECDIRERRGSLAA